MLHQIKIIQNRLYQIEDRLNFINSHKAGALWLPKAYNEEFDYWHKDTKKEVFLRRIFMTISRLDDDHINQDLITILEMTKKVMEQAEEMLVNTWWVDELEGPLLKVIKTLNTYINILDQRIELLNTLGDDNDK